MILRDLMKQDPTLSLRSLNFGEQSTLLSPKQNFGEDCPCLFFHDLRPWEKTTGAWDKWVIELEGTLGTEHDVGQRMAAARRVSISFVEGAASSAFHKIRNPLRIKRCGLLFLIFISLRFLSCRPTPILVRLPLLANYPFWLATPFKHYILPILSYPFDPLFDPQFHPFQIPLFYWMKG